MLADDSYEQRQNNCQGFRKNNKVLTDRILVKKPEFIKHP